MTINGTAAILLALYVAAAERKGVPRAKLTGTIQNDILKEYASRGTDKAAMFRFGCVYGGASMYTPQAQNNLVRAAYEALTDATEARIIEIMHDLEQYGGMVHAIEDGYLQGLIADEAYRMHQAVEAGTRPVVGVNRFVSDEPAPEIVIYELDAERRDRQLKRLSKVRAERVAAAVFPTGTPLDVLVRAIRTLTTGSPQPTVEESCVSE